MDAVSDEDDAEETPDEDAGSKKRKVNKGYFDLSCSRWHELLQRPTSKAKPASKSKSKKAKKTKAVSEEDDDDE